MEIAACPHRLAVLCCPGATHDWLLGELQRCLPLLLPTVRHEVCGEEVAYHAFQRADAGKPDLSLWAVVSQELMASLATAGERLIVLDEPLTAAVAGLSRQGGCSLPVALRAVTQAKASHAELLRALGDPSRAKASVWAVRGAADREDLLRTIAAMLDRATDTAARSDLQEASDQVGTSHAPVHQHRNECVIGDWHLACGTAPHDLGFNGAGFDFHVTGALFTAGDEFARSAEGRIEAMGPSRILIFGPYLFFPVIRVYMEFRFRISEDLHGELFRFNVFSGMDLIRTAKTTLRSDGTVALRMAVDNPDHRLPLSIQIINARGALSGFLELFSARFSDRAIQIGR